MIVFSVKNRANMIKAPYEKEIHAYISKIAKILTKKLICINGTENHLHILFSMKPNVSISDFVRVVKSNSSRWINQKDWFDSRFAWQKGFGVFSYSQSQLKNIVSYIKNQKKHHKSDSFEDEYIRLMTRFKIGYDEKYVFE